MAENRTQLERAVREALDLTRGVGRAQGNRPNISQAANLLGLSRPTVSRYARQIRETGKIGISERYVKTASEKLSRGPDPNQAGKAFSGIVQKALEKSGNNYKQAAKQLGITPQEVGKIVKARKEGRTIPYKKPETILGKLEKLKAAPRYLQGEKIAREVRRIEGREGGQLYALIYYKLEPGERLPSGLEMPEGRKSYQAIAIGKYKGETRAITSSFMGSPEEALAALEREMGRYKGFKSAEIHIAVYIAKPGPRG